MAKVTKKKNATVTRGRKKGDKPSQPVVMLNRWSLNFYTTIKDKDGSISGRDYSKHSQHVASLLDKFGKAQDTQTVKFLKAVKKCNFKEDIIKYVPNLISLTMTTETNYPIGTFYPEDTITLSITDKAATLEAIEARKIEIENKLIADGHNEIAAGLIVKWNQLKTAKKPPSKGKDPTEIEKEQLKAFSW